MNLAKDVLVYSVVILSLAMGGYFILNKFNYFDVSSLCYIDLDGSLLNGNKNTIVEALKSIKRKDKQQYKTVCKYVQKISENYCIGSDWHLDPKWRENSIGKDCFIRGSKTIYLYPQEEMNLEVVSKRAKSIEQLSRASKEFWQKTN